MKELAARLDALCDALPFQTSWYLKDLATGARADRLGDVPVPSASTRKISIMMAALKAVHDGKLALDQKVIIDAKYQDNDSGTFQHLTPGFWITFRDALVMMIIVSDNTCTGQVVDLVGLGEIQRFCESVGMTRTVHRFGIPPRLGPDHALDQVTTTTPNDQGMLLELILRGTDRPRGRRAHGRDSRAVPARARHPVLAEAQGAAALAAARSAPRSPTRPAPGRAASWTRASCSRADRPLFILTAYTEHVPAALPDGTPGFTAANTLIGRMARVSWDALGG